MSLNNDEVDIINQAKAGDQEAFDTLYARHEISLYGYIRARVWNDSDAQDLAQELWVVILRDISLLDLTRGSFIAFAKNRAKFLIIDYYKRFGIEIPVSQQDSEPESQSYSMLEDIISLVDANPSQTTEGTHILSVEFDRFLWRTFNGSSPPWQIIVFGFAKLMEWKPEEIVNELSDHCLKVLAERLEDDLNQVFPDRKEYIHSCLRELQGNMDHRFDQVVQDPNTRKTYPAIMDRNMGNILLRELYTGEKPADNISKWWFAVKRRVLSEMSRVGQ